MHHRLNLQARLEGVPLNQFVVFPLAYLVACSAVARARRGDVPDWRGAFSRLGQIADLLPRRQERFSSPARAQMWFEQRRQGRRLPALVGLLLPFELALLFVAGDDRPELVVYPLLGVLLTRPAWPHSPPRRSA